MSESEPEPTNLGESEAVTQNSARVEELVSAANTAWAEADVERLRRLAVELDNLRQTGLAAALRRAAVQFERGALPAAHT